MKLLKPHNNIQTILVLQQQHEHVMGVTLLRECEHATHNTTNHFKSMGESVFIDLFPNHADQTTTKPIFYNMCVCLCGPCGSDLAPPFFKILPRLLKKNRRKATRVVLEI